MTPNPLIGEYPAILLTRIKPAQQTSDPSADNDRATYQRLRNSKNQKLTRAKRSQAEVLENSWRRYARPPAPTPGSKNAGVSRKTVISNAYMHWSDVEQVYRCYMAAAVMTELLGETYVVDHTVPLRHPLVCGLHTHTNLKVISSYENSLKGNSYWPDMPEVTRGTLDFLLENTQYLSNTRPKSARKQAN